MKRKLDTHKEAGFGALGVIAIIVIIGLMIALVWVFLSRTVLQKQTATSVQPATSASAPTPTQVQPDAITAKAKAYLASSYTILENQGAGDLTDSQVSISTSKATPPYKVGDTPYYVTYDEGSSLYAGFKLSADYSASTNDIKFRTAVAQIYVDAGLTLMKDALTNDDQAHYQGAGLTCTIETPNNPTSSNTVSCGLISAYPAALEKIKPILAAGNNPVTDEANTFYTAPVFRASKTPGYTIATMGIGDINGAGAKVIFYKKDSGQWQYFRSAQGEIGCEEYNTSDLRAAFKGDACYDSNAANSEGIVS